ncbi:MAG: extracellular solute-binding protein [Chloroflexi bacterium]|nr:extracellular solute-binding protein [Chloroflexota bacterium]
MKLHHFHSWLLIILVICIGSYPSMSHAQAVDPHGEALIFWHPHTGEREKALNELVARFNAENEWKITVEARNLQNPGLLYDQLVLQLTSAPENRTLPNVFVAAPYETASLALGGPLLDLSAFIEDGEWGWPDREDFVPSSAELGHDPFTDAQWGWPERLYAETLYVNMTALKKLGFTSPPITLAELSDMACQFFDQNNTPAFLLETRAGVWAGLAAGGIFENDPTPTYTLNTASMTNAVQTMNDRLGEGCITRQTTAFAAQEEFSAGHTLFYFGSTSALPIVREAILANPDTAFDWQIAPLPGSPIPYLAGPTMSIFSHTPEADLAAWLFVRWWLSPEINAEWNRITGSLPIRESSGEMMAADFENFPQWQTAWEIVKQGGQFEPSVAAQDVVRLEIEFAIGRILDDPTSLERELKALSALANEVLGAYAPTTLQASP